MLFFVRMPVCIVEGCATTSKRKTDDIMLHSFPKDKELIKRWLQQMPQDFGNLEEFAERVFTSTRGNYRMCSLHFTRSAYEIRGLTTFLKRDAIPTLFPETIAIQLPPKGLSSFVLNSELHTIHARATTSTHQPIRQIVVGLCHEPSVAPQVHNKTEDETSSSGFEIPLDGTPRIRIKNEDETTSGFLSTELHTVHTMPPDNGQQELVEGCGQQEPSTASQKHAFTVLTLDQRANLLGTPEPTSIRSQGFMPVVSRKRPYTPKNIKTIGTMTEYLPGKVHKSIQFDKSMGTNHKSFQVCLRPFQSSIGIQCNIVSLPSLKTLSPCQIKISRESEDSTTTLHMDLR